MISLILDKDFRFEQDIRELLMAFYPGEDFIYEENEASLLCVYGKDDEIRIEAAGPARRAVCSEGLEPTGDRAQDKSELKRAFYSMLSGITGKELPWGTLTGIRPVKLYEKEFQSLKAELEARHRAEQELCPENEDVSAALPEESRRGALNKKGREHSPYSPETQAKIEEKLDEAARERMRRDYFISEEKLSLLSETALRERTALSGKDIKQGFSLYVNIPFCPSTCLYCSFTSNPIERFSGRIGEYLEAMRRELRLIEASRKAKAGEELYSPISGKELQTIYIGGGTPTALSASDLERLIVMIEEETELSSLYEFTVEAGRPDSIDRDKLRVLKGHGIDRISINPQTMNDKTLRLIGRRHTAEDVERAYGLAREEGFDNINMDVIMGLPGEELKDVEHTLSRIAELKPESLTVHALAVKRAARLNTEGLAYAGLARAGAEEASRMIELGADCAKSLGMKPYYLYRQKNMAGNQENVGYCIPGRENLYNILMMEEKHGVVGIGAGASTKLIVPNPDPELYGGNPDRVERHENMKNVSIYLERIDEVMEKKRRFLAFQALS